MSDCSKNGPDWHEIKQTWYSFFKIRFHGMSQVDPDPGQSGSILCQSVSPDSLRFKWQQYLYKYSTIALCVAAYGETQLIGFLCVDLCMCVLHCTAITCVTFFFATGVRSRLRYSSSGFLEKGTILFLQGYMR